MLEQIRRGFIKGLIPKLTFEGTSGVYCLSNNHKAPIVSYIN